MDTAQRASRWGAWLRDQLDRRGWRQADLAREARLPRDRVSRWVNGQGSPTHQNAVLVANALGVPAEEAVAAAGLDGPHTPARRPLPLELVPDSDLIGELLRRARARERLAAAGGPLGLIDAGVLDALGAVALRRPYPPEADVEAGPA